MVTVRVSETYDLSTKVGKMGLVGIHTPTGSLIDKLWPGLVLQHKKFRFVKCDVAMACASMLPADPLQIGVEAGAIAPQDMFNPILYRAVSNDSMSNILAYIMARAGTNALGDTDVNQGSIVDINDSTFTQSDASTAIDQFEMYYGFLADSDGWRKAMPQAGLQMSGLYPLVYQMLSNYGTNVRVGNQAESDGGVYNGQATRGSYIAANDNISAPDVAVGKELSIFANQFRGPSMRMPSIDTVYFGSGSGNSESTGTIVPSGNGAPVVSNTGSVPPCYVAMILLPPAKLNQLYYRMKVTWTIEFSGLRSMADIGAWNTVNTIGQYAYGTDYADQVASMAETTNMVDTNGASIQKVMEGA